jgi:hypothetical protein
MTMLILGVHLLRTNSTIRRCNDLVLAILIVHLTAIMLVSAAIITTPMFTTASTITTTFKPKEM